MDGEKIDAEAVEAWRPPVADAATDDDGGEERALAGGDFSYRRLLSLLGDVHDDDLDLDDIDDCDPADDEPDFVRDWVDED